MPEILTYRPDVNQQNSRKERMSDFKRCRSCRSLIPIASTRCRMCGSDEGSKEGGAETFPQQGNLKSIGGLFLFILAFFAFLVVAVVLVSLRKI